MLNRCSPAICRYPFTAVLLVISMFLTSCRSDQQTAAVELHVLVAASLADSIKEIARQFERDFGIRVTVTSAGSNQLAQQILAGAPADIFVSADRTWELQLREADLVQESDVLLKNRLVVVVPIERDVNFKTVQEYVSKGSYKLAVANQHVPAGKYARQALRNLNLLQTLESEGRLVNASNVRMALAYVERGEADLAIVYFTDAVHATRVEQFCELPTEAYDEIRYPNVLLKTSRRPLAARQFYDYLGSHSARQIFQEMGFDSPDPPPLLNGG